jgi:hypothetical protein
MGNLFYERGLEPKDMGIGYNHDNSIQFLFIFMLT